MGFGHIKFSVRYLDSVRDKVSVCIVGSVYLDKLVYKDNSTYTGCSVLFYKVCIGSVSFKVLMIGHGSGFDTDGSSVRYFCSMDMHLAGYQRVSTEVTSTSNTRDDWCHWPSLWKASRRILSEVKQIPRFSVKSSLMYKDFEIQVMTVFVEAKYRWRVIITSSKSFQKSKFAADNLTTGASVDQSLSSETRRYHDQAGRLIDSVREMKDSIVVNLVCIHVPIDALTLDGIDLDTSLPQAVMKWITLVNKARDLRVLQIGIRAKVIENQVKVIMSSATSAVTYTSVYTDSEPGRAFWGADDEEVSEGGIPRVIVLGYDGLPLQPVAPPSPDYVPGPENPQTPPVPQDEDEHEFLAEEQPLPGHVTESDPEEDPEEYEDDETEDGPVDYPMDGGDDGDDDDGDSSRDDANDEDEDEEDEEDEEEEEHLAPADSTTVIPIDEPVFPPEGTEPVIPPSSTDTRITV
ncbi:hypothetical protein Tco_0587058 [Tanacetum coccineum]